ncbi:hypothetical protein [Lonepinella sp. MS14434]|uniref:hypothetical protein n=1 Tax=Lonepinella sp. MS14434 TaxID=3003617 RepID=UPI0036DC89AC
MDFSEIVVCQKSGDRQKAGAGGILAQATTDLEKIVADAVMITTNTMHKVAEIKFPSH